jgi:hypothetical protein
MERELQAIWWSWKVSLRWEEWISQRVD